jgi:predicted acyltransferase
MGVLVAVILIVYWILLVQFGDLSAEGNLGARIDRALMLGHLWRPRWDPEGLLSTLPAVATALLGVVAGLWLKTSATLERKVRVLLGLGVAGLVAGQTWHLIFPINKQLWTSSYVLLTAGLASIILAVCMYAIDIRGIRGWSRPFVVLGRNAITLFVVSGLIGKLLILIKLPTAGGESTTLQQVIFEHGFLWIGPPKVASLTYALVFLLLMYGMCDLMSRRGWFLRA